MILDRKEKKKKKKYIIFKIMGRCKKFCGILSGLQENPPVYALNQAPAKGHIKVLLYKNNLYVSGRFSHLSSPYIASHIHQGAVGVNGPVVQGFPLEAKLSCDKLSGSFDSCRNKFSLTEEQKELLLNGQYYINVHSVNYPGGEIRAQILPKKGKKCKQYIAILSGENEVPPVTGTQGTGKVVAVLNCDKLSLTGSFTALTSNYAASHIHQAPPGSNGPVVFALNPVTNLPPLSGNYYLIDNTFTLTNTQKVTLDASGFYINIHTANYPGGEIRGQLFSL